MRTISIAVCFLLIVVPAAFPAVQEKEDGQGGITLRQLEQMALQNNPTIAQAGATVEAAEGRKKQARLYPNPIVGVQVEELSQRDPIGRTDEHVFFVAEQTVLLGGKRGKAGDLFEREKEQAQTGLKAQKLRVLNTVRILYYQALAAQNELQVRTQLQKIAEEGGAITEELFNVGQADRPDVLEAKIEAQTAELAVVSAEQERERTWRQLASVIGSPDMPVSNVSGDFDRSVPEIDREKLLDALLTESLQLKAAELRVQRSQAGLALAKAQRVPDLRFRGGIGYNYEKIAPANEPVGLEGFFEVGIPLPLFNRNQGKIAVAHAESLHAQKEVDRVKLALTRQFSDLYSDYVKSITIARKFKDELLPSAQEAHQLYLTSFRQMAAAYPQVLIAQKNRYQLEIEYVNAQKSAWTAALQLQGFLLSEGALDAPPFAFSTDDNAQVFE